MSPTDVGGRTSAVGEPWPDAPAASADEPPWWSVVDVSTATAAVIAYVAAVAGSTGALGLLVLDPANTWGVAAATAVVAAGALRLAALLGAHRTRRSRSTAVEVICAATTPLVALPVGGPVVVGLSKWVAPDGVPLVVIPTSASALLTLYGGAVVAVWFRRRQLPASQFRGADA